MEIYEAYHIDRSCRINEGQVNALDEQGGNEKALKLKQYPDLPEKIIEDIFEKCRENHYPDCISRLKAFYVFERWDLEKWARKLNLFYVGLSGKEEISCNLNVCTIGIKDMMQPYDSIWLDRCRGNNNLPLDEATINKMAHCYWNNEMTQEPLREGLCSFPVEVIRVVPLWFFDKESQNIRQEWLKNKV